MEKPTQPIRHNKLTLNCECDDCKRRKLNRAIQLTDLSSTAGPSGYQSTANKSQKRPILPSSSEDDDILIGQSTAKKPQKRPILPSSSEDDDIVIRPLPLYQQQNENNAQVAGKKENASVAAHRKKRKISEGVGTTIILPELRRRDNSDSDYDLNPHLRTSLQASTSGVFQIPLHPRVNRKTTTDQSKDADRANSDRIYNSRVFYNRNIDRRTIPPISSSALATAIQLAKDLPTSTKRTAPSLQPSISKSGTKAQTQNSTKSVTSKKRSGKFTKKKDKKKNTSQISSVHFER